MDVSKVVTRSFHRRRPSVRLTHAASTHVGRVRHSNQDNHGFANGLYVLADGMGGHRGGEVASTLAVSTTLNSFDGVSTVGLVRSVIRANQTILEQSRSDETLHGMGTTICATAAGVTDVGLDCLSVANVGDSRVYRFANNQLTQITDDHSLVADLVRAGDLTSEEAARHPQRNILTRALGIEDDPVVDTWELLPIVGDRYLLCSDGLFNELSDERITEILVQNRDLISAANELVDRAVDAGGHDNVTVLLVDVVEAPDPEGLDWTLPEKRAEQLSSLSSSGVAGLSSSVWRPVAIGVGLMALLATVFAGIGLYARHGWYVGEYNGQVAVFKGRPSGVLWFDPTVEELTGVSLLELSEQQQQTVIDVVSVGSLLEARDVIQGFSSVNN